MFQKILFPLLTAFAIWFFIAGIPIDTYDAHTTLITIIAGVVTTALFSISIFKLLPPPKTDKPKEDYSGCVIVAVILGFFFGFSIFLIYRSTHLVSEELKENGKYTVATIIDGSSFKTRKADFTNIKVMFTSESGKWHAATIDIPASQFNNYSIKQQIPIVYSPKYPTLVKVLHSDTEISRYTGKEARDITISDLEHLFDIDTPEKTIEYLNNINQKWNHTAGDEINNYYNIFKNIRIKVSTNEVTYVHTGVDINLFEKELEEGNYEKIPANRYPVYFNDKYTIVRRIERVPIKEHSTLLEDFNNLTIVSIIKK